MFRTVCRLVGTHEEARMRRKEAGGETTRTAEGQVRGVLLVGDLKSAGATKVRTVRGYLPRQVRTFLPQVPCLPRNPSICTVESRYSTCTVLCLACTGAL